MPKPSPRHVAFVGGQGVFDVIEHRVSGAFSGPVWPVNPKYQKLGGRPCFRSRTCRGIALIVMEPDGTKPLLPPEGRDF